MKVCPCILFSDLRRPWLCLPEQLQAPIGSASVVQQILVFVVTPPIAQTATDKLS